nr:uncharacterized protein LOC129255430 [Lytechinus pictus]
MSDQENRVSRGEIDESWWGDSSSYTRPMAFFDYVLLVIAGFIIMMIIICIFRECSCDFIKRGISDTEPRNDSTDDLRIIQDDYQPETCSSVDLHHLSHHNFRVLEEYSQRIAQVMQGPPPSYDEAIKDRPPACRPDGMVDDRIVSTSMTYSHSQHPFEQDDGDDISLLSRN